MRRVLFKSNQDFNGFNFFPNLGFQWDVVGLGSGIIMSSSDYILKIFFKLFYFIFL